MIKSGAQSARAADAKSDSTAQRVPSGPTLYRLGCAVLRAARLNRLPRNPCSSGVAILVGNRFPQAAASLPAAISNHESNHLTGLPTQRQPNPAFPRFLQHE